MPQVEQVLGRPPRGVEVVDGDDVRRAGLAHHAHERAAHRDEPLEFVVARLQPHGDQPVEPLAGEELVEHARASLGAGSRVVEREVVAVTQEGILDALEHLGEEPAADIGHDDADVLRLAGGEAHRGGRGDIAEGCRGIQHPVARLVRDIAAPGQSAARRRFGDARGARDIGDSCHVHAPSRQRSASRSRSAFGVRR